jgi:hypothetical protein
MMAAAASSESSIAAVLRFLFLNICKILFLGFAKRFFVSLLVAEAGVAQPEPQHRLHGTGRR